MKYLKDVSLVAVATQDIEETIQALEYSLRHISFQEVLFFAHYNPKPLSNHFHFIPINKFENVGEWGKFIVYDLYKYIKTKHILLIHADGFIVNPNSWHNDFLRYDYIGAPWPLPTDNISYRDIHGNISRVGNSVSLRSYKLLSFPNCNHIPWESTFGYFHEDGFICTKIKHLLEENGIEFAPFETACLFSHEIPLPETKGIKPFVFHKWEGDNKNYPRFGRYKTNLFSRLKKQFIKLMLNINSSKI